MSFTKIITKIKTLPVSDNPDVMELVRANVKDLSDFSHSNYGVEVRTIRSETVYYASLWGVSVRLLYKDFKKLSGWANKFVTHKEFNEKYYRI